jgi:flagellar basal-body rod protein FlgB
VKLVPQYDSLAFGEAALKARSYRQEILASNMANADTPNYKARDVDFAQVLKARLSGQEQQQASQLALEATDAGHIVLPVRMEQPGVLYRTPLQPSLDGNTVDADTERSHFAQNAMMMQAAIEFFGGTIKTRMSAITGQPG